MVPRAKPRNRALRKHLPHTVFLAERTSSGLTVFARADADAITCTGVEPRLPSNNLLFQKYHGFQGTADEFRSQHDLTRVGTLYGYNVERFTSLAPTHIKVNVSEHNHWCCLDPDTSSVLRITESTPVPCLALCVIRPQ